LAKISVFRVLPLLKEAESLAHIVKKPTTEQKPSIDSISREFQSHWSIISPVLDDLKTADREGEDYTFDDDHEAQE
jgi:hypothetical protein